MLDLTLIERARAEYLEMPGLRLTPAQAQRLWGLTVEQATAVLLHLSSVSFLQRTQDGRFVRV